MGTPGSPPIRLTVVPDKWVRPTRRPTNLSNGPNRPSWQPARPPEDLPEDSPDDLIHHDLKIWRTRQDLGRFQSKQIDRIWQDVKRRLRSPGRNRPGVWEPTSSAGQYKADEATPCTRDQPRNPQAIYTNNWT
jgi:hypothetical protein